MGKIRHFIIFCLVACTFVSAWCVAGENQNKTAINKIAAIMYRLKHFPSPQGNSELKAIIVAPNSTENERTIATAMINMQHQVVSNDILLLKNISSNNAASQHERELADILLSFSHRPTKQDKNQLKKMME